MSARYLYALSRETHDDDNGDGDDDDGTTRATPLKNSRTPRGPGGWGESQAPERGGGLPTFNLVI